MGLRAFVNSVINVGFTGSRAGMTAKQTERFTQELSELKRSFENRHIVFRHGDCVGADAEAHKIVVDEFLGTTEIFPCNITWARAWCESETIHTPQPPLNRNKIIVDRSTYMFACPSGAEILRSGTWSTIRYARKNGVWLCVIMPNGEVTKVKSRDI